MKIFFTVIFSFIAIFSFIVATPKAYALDTCQSQGITYNPQVFLVNSPDFALNFSSQSNFLNGKETRLYFDKGIGPWDDWVSRPTTVINNSFSLTIEDKDLQNQGSHEGKIQWMMSSQWKDLCSGIKYTVGTQNPDKCEINPPLPPQIRPRENIDIRFLGKPNSTYQLRFNGGPSGYTATTDGQGQGRFKGVVVNGSPGDVVKIGLIRLPIGSGSCFSTIKLNINAPPYTPHTPPPTEQISPGVPGTGFQPTKCKEGTPQEGIETALGCIPVKDTAGFITWFLRLAIGIGGGIAFLLMLFGVFQIITSAGDPERLKTGKELITSALIGLLMIIFSLFLLRLIGVEILKIPGFGG